MHEPTHQMPAAATELPILKSRDRQRSEMLLLFFPFPIKARYFVIGYGAIELSLGLMNRQGDNVAHFAHIGGMLFGYIILKIWQKQGRLYS